MGANMKTMRSTRALAAVAMTAVVAFGVTACGDDDDTATVAFTTPADGARVAGGVHLAMTADGLTIEKAGEAHAGAGHFHVIADDGCGAKGAAVAKDADHVHFGGGQSEGTVYLEPGEHELCLQAGDGSHVALGVTDTVKVTVGITDRDEWCAVVDETDRLFAAVDNSGDEFTVKQAGYENIRRLFRQLDGGIDQVDADVREDVRAVLGFGESLAATVATATDEADAIAKSEEFWEGEQGDTTLPGADWIDTTCGVDIDG